MSILKSKTSLLNNLVRLSILSLFLIGTSGTSVMCQESAGGALLLFKSGFEEGVTLDPPVRVGNQWWQAFKGKDDQGGDWSSALPDKGTGAFQPLVSSNKNNLEDFVETRIETVMGPNGTPTRVLYQEVKQDDPSFGSLSRNNYIVFPSPDFTQAYIRYWVKFQPDLEMVMSQGCGWRNVMEWKETDDVYRFTLYVVHGSKGLFWRAIAQWGAGGNAPVDWEITNQQVEVPVGEWFELEAFYKLSKRNGQVWFAVNGEPIGSHYGRTKRKNPVNRWMPFKVYTGSETFEKGYTAYQWIDDVEIWTDIPGGTRSGSSRRQVKR